MYVPKSALAIVAVIAALILGWVSRGLVADAPSSTSLAADSPEPERAAADPMPPIRITIESDSSPDAPDSGAPQEREPVPSIPDGRADSTTVLTGPDVPSASSDGGTSETQASVASLATKGSDSHLGNSGNRNGASTQAAETDGVPYASPPLVTIEVQGSGARVSSPEAYEAGQGTTSASPSDAVGSEATDSPDSAEDSPGTEILVAQDGSIVFIGNDGDLNANTGPASSGGAVAIEAADTEISSNNDGDVGVDHENGSSGTVVNTGVDPEKTTGAGNAPTVREVPVATSAPSAAPPSADPGRTNEADGATNQSGNSTAEATPHPAEAVHASGSLVSVVPQEAPGSRSVAISGFEDHSVDVVGNQQIVTYDDTNVMINRDGKINANTGDTDSSGLNVMDATDSVVRSGNSGDAEGNDDEEEDEEEEEQDQEPPPPSTPVAETQTTLEEPASDDGDEDSDLSENPDSSIPAQPDGSAYGTVTDEGASVAVGDRALVIGAYGFDDVSIRSVGDRNIVSYDDSNVVIGGEGDVNAQIGDSDTGGAVVTDVHNSYIEAGCEGDLCYPDTVGRLGDD